MPIHPLLAKRLTTNNVLDAISAICAEWHDVQKNRKNVGRDMDSWHRQTGKLYAMENDLALLLGVDQVDIRAELRAGRL